MREVRQVDQDPNTDNRVVNALDVLRFQDIVVEEAVVLFANARPGTLDHVLGEIEGIDPGAPLSDLPRDIAIAAAYLQHAAALRQVREDKVEFEIALHRVVYVDPGLVFFGERAPVPMQIGAALGHGVSQRAAISATARSICGWMALA